MMKTEIEAIFNEIKAIQNGEPRTEAERMIRTLKTESARLQERADREAEMQAAIEAEEMRRADRAYAANLAKSLHFQPTFSPSEITVHLIVYDTSEN